MHIAIKRVYDDPSDDGYRVLVDRLWPRGLSKEAARVDEWLKDLAPSSALRRWFAHDPTKAEEFAARYDRELDENEPALARFIDALDKRRRLTLLYAAREPDAPHARILRGRIERHLGERGRS